MAPGGGVVDLVFTGLISRNLTASFFLSFFAVRSFPCDLSLTGLEAEKIFAVGWGGVWSRWRGVQGV